MNPDSLELVDTSAMEIEAGDIVLVIDEKEKVKQMQKGHGEWVEDMTTVRERKGWSGCYSDGLGFIHMLEQLHNNP